MHGIDVIGANRLVGVDWGGGLASIFKTAGGIAEGFSSKTPSEGAAPAAEVLARAKQALVEEKRRAAEAEKKAASFRLWLIGGAVAAVAAAALGFVTFGRKAPVVGGAV